MHGRTRTNLMQATISKLILETGVLVKEQGLGVPIDTPRLQIDRPFSFFPLLPSVLSQPDPLVVEHSYSFPIAVEFTGMMVATKISWSAQNPSELSIVPKNKPRLLPRSGSHVCESALVVMPLRCSR
jgi:hypothetical protein